MITTTLNRIRAHNPCTDGWQKLLAHLNKTGPDDEPLPYAVILESNGLDDALWAMRCEPGHDKEWRLFAVWCARQVQHLMTDACSIAALDVAERFANGDATGSELAAACAAAACAAAAWDAAGDAACAAAAWDAAGDAARAAACAAAGEGDAAGDAALAAARAAQRARFLEVVS